MNVLTKVLGDQRRALIVALGLVILSLWFGQYGDWVLAGALALGVVLGLANHVATEYWLFKTINADDPPSRGEMTKATLLRLGALTVVAVVAAVLLWPDGIGVLLGLAIFRLLALMMTTIPLLKELRKS